MKTYTQQQLEAIIKPIVNETIKAMQDWFENETHVVDRETGRPIENTEVVLNQEHKSPTNHYIYPRLAKLGVQFVKEE